MSPPQILRWPDMATLATALAEEVANRLQAGVDARGRASLVVPGGSTPGPFFDALAARPLPWDRIEVTLNDERWVEPSEDGSNERQLRQRLLVGPAAKARLVPLKTPAPTPAEAVDEVSAAIGAMARPFDVMVLGMGGDGHTASLFPGSPQLASSLEGDEAQVQAVDEPGARGASQRITLALPALLDSRFVVLLATGEEKLQTLARAEAGSDPLAMPIRAILQEPAPPLHLYWCP